MTSIAIDRLDGLSSSTAIKGPVRVATLSNIALTGLQTVDGVSLAAGDRVLVKSQTSQSENGIYVVDTGPWRRSKDFAGNRDVRKGSLVHVTEGDTLEASAWYVSSADPIVIGTTAISFTASTVVNGDQVKAIALEKLENLGDLDDVVEARAHLGLGTAATTDADAYAIAGSALPTGGSTGQVLLKQSGDNYDAEWVSKALGTGDMLTSIYDPEDVAGPAVFAAATDASSFGFFLDQDDLTDDDATKAPSQQSIKANIDARAPRGRFDTVAAMLADTDFGYSAARFAVATGQVIEAQGYRYAVAASGASDHHLATAGGVKLYVAPGTSVDGRAMGLESTTASDQSAAVQKWFDVCVALGVAPSLSAPLSVRIDSPVTYDPTGGTVPAEIDLRLLTLTGAGFRAGSVAGFMREVNFYAPKITRTASWDADSDASMLGTDAGLILYNFGTSKIWLNAVAGFTVGVAYHSENYWFAYNTVYGGHLTDNRYDEVLRTLLGSVVPGGEFCNENLFVGGARRQTSAVNALGNAYGTVITAGTGAYKGQNANRWLAPCYELGNPAGATWRVPVLMAGAGAYNRWENVRHESGIGPFGIADARGNMNTAHHCEYSASYEAGSVAGTGAGWLQVNGAYANTVAGQLIPRPRLAISPMASLLSSTGDAAVPRLAGPFILKRNVSATALRVGAAGTDFVTNRNALQSGGTIGVLLEIDASKIKTFGIAQDVVAGFGGRFFAQAFDASGAVLTGNATDSWGSEPYVKFSPTQTTTTLFGGGYSQQSDNAAQSVLFTCRSEVVKLLVGFIVGSFPLALKGIEITGYPTTQLAGSTTSGIACIGLTVPTTDDGRMRTASANPATAGVHGQYLAGEIIGNSAPAAGSPDGWVCSTAGWLAAAWAISTAYAVPGHVVINDSGKAYALVTAGTSASSGGPTGTGSSITDGTCVWQYIGVKAAFLPTPTLPLEGTATYDPPSLAAGALDTTQTMTVTGAALGDIVDISFSTALGGARLEAWVSAANTVSYRFSNPTGSAIDLASGTVKARIRK